MNTCVIVAVVLLKFIFQWFASLNIIIICVTQIYEDARKEFLELKAEWEQMKKEFAEARKDSVSLEKDLDKASRLAEQINQEMRLKVGL